MSKLNRNQIARKAASLGLGFWLDYNTKPASYVICDIDGDGLPVPAKRLHVKDYTAKEAEAFLAGWKARGQKEREAES